jgi:chemotaxis protein methyltransferase CheR
MGFNAETLGLPTGINTLLRDLIHDRTGLFFDNGKCDILIDKLSPLVIERGFTSFLDYYYLLKYDAETSEEWNRVQDALSVQETYFWREADQVRALVDVLMPAYYSTLRAEPLRIWSAACATGEEPLTIAIALNEAGWFERAPIEIYASDASAQALEKARLGLYRERSFRNMPPGLRDKYFTGERGVWRVAPELSARIKWTRANLMEKSEIALLATAPVIFCRNVFIYFSADAISKVAGLLAEQMPTPGYLFIGAAQSLLRLATAFELQEMGGAFVYVKK